MTSPPLSQQLLILVVDDSATSRVVIEKQLKKLGCNVATAHDGTSGFAAMESREFDLVLLDCQMPDMSGYDVARLVRQREQQQELAHTPIIAISAETDAGHMQLCLDSGMDGVLNKPLPIDELQRMLSLWCDVEVEAAQPINLKEIKSVDLQALFRSTSFDDFSAMQAAANQSDMLAVGRLAHRMKGAALTMSASAIVTTLERIETIVRHKDEANALAAEIEILQQKLNTI